MGHQFEIEGRKYTLTFDYDDVWDKRWKITTRAILREYKENDHGAFTLRPVGIGITRWQDRGRKGDRYEKANGRFRAFLRMAFAVCYATNEFANPDKAYDALNDAFEAYCKLPQEALFVVFEEIAHGDPTESVKLTRECRERKKTKAEKYIDELLDGFLGFLGFEPEPTKSWPTVTGRLSSSEPNLSNFPQSRSQEKVPSPPPEEPPFEVDDEDVIELVAKAQEILARLENLITRYEAELAIENAKVKAG